MTGSVWWAECDWRPGSSLRSDPATRGYGLDRDSAQAGELIRRSRLNQALAWSAPLVAVTQVRPPGRRHCVSVTDLFDHGHAGSSALPITSGDHHGGPQRWAFGLAIGGVPPLRLSVHGVVVARRSTGTAARRACGPPHVRRRIESALALDAIGARFMARAGENGTRDDEPNRLGAAFAAALVLDTPLPAGPCRATAVPRCERLSSQRLSAIAEPQVPAQ